MRVVQTDKNWMAALVVGVLLVGAAVGMAQLENGRPEAVKRGVEDARELSTVFRHVSKEALPSIVSIRTVGKAAKLTGNARPFEDEDSPLGELFKNQPELREFFRRLPDRMPAPHGMGSGFIIDPSGVIMTNNHVVQDAAEVTVHLQDGREFTATDIKTDPRTDVAIIRIEANEKLPALKLGSSEEVEIGDWVLAVGSPFGLDGTVTAGIISAKGRNQQITQRDNFLQTDAAINPGNSGGPLLNLDGQVIGINTAISSRSGGYDGIGFAIPVDMAKWVSTQLVEKGEVKRAYLGVGIQPVDKDLAEKFNTPAGSGALVTQVMPESPAEKASLQTGDVILDFGGQKISGPEVLQNIVEKVEVGKGTPMTILRNGEKKTLDVVLAEMPGDYGLASAQQPVEEAKKPKNEKEFGDLGIEIADLTADVAKQLGYEKPDEVKGVVITSVDDGSPAEKVGLRTGYVVQKVGDREITSPADFTEAMKGADLSKGILMLVRVPQGGTRFLVIKSKS